MAGNDLTCEVTPANMSVAPLMSTNAKTEIQCKKIPVLVIEMEDVCYHAGSGLLLPEDPAGTKEGESDSQTQKKVSGVATLSLVLRHAKESPYEHLLIAGHDDTEGSPQQGFDVSKKRAEGAYYLLAGKKKEWCEHALNSHTIKDYQQIMRYYRFTRGWDCDPGAIDDSWGPKTERAVKAFFNEMNKLGGVNKADSSKVSASAKKKWPIEAWEAVYDLYEHLMFSILIGQRWTPQDAAKARGCLRFLDENKPTVACGESFPISHYGKDKFQSQANRRVEFLFFNVDTRPKLPLPCPAIVTAKHTEAQCPLHKIKHFKRNYIKPDDLHSALYHIKFEYYDKIREEVCVVPDGLKINAFKAGNPPNYHWDNNNGVYAIRIYNVPGGKREADVHFTFETKNAWVYTKDKKSQPRIVHTFGDVDSNCDPKLRNTPITREELAKKPFAERMHYYDLPEQWDSRNWWCKVDQKGDDFEKNITEITTVSAPLTFFLDTIVLASSDESLLGIAIGALTPGKQTNYHQKIKDKDAHGAPKELSSESRYSLFYTDIKTRENIAGTMKNMRRLKIYNPEEKQPCFSNQEFKRNRIYDVPGHSKIIYFCNNFYSISSKRSKSSDTGLKVEDGHLIGAYLAVKNDQDIHRSKVVKATDSKDTSKGYALNNCGNYELHYFHELDEFDGKPLSYLFIYWSCRFEAKPIIESSVIAINAGLSADIANHRGEGIKNALERLNKGYLLEKSSGSKNLSIQPFIFIEAKDDSCGGKEKALVNILANTTVAGKYVPAWMKPQSAQFRAYDYKDSPTYFGNNDPDNLVKDTNGKQYQVLTNHHEMGHATGNWDDYLYDYNEGSPLKRSWDGLYRFNHPYTAEGGPYRHDKLGRMSHNRTMRIRNFWKYVCWLHDESGHGKELHSFLGDLKFHITFPATTFIHKFSLNEVCRNTSSPYKRGDNKPVGNNGKCDLLLYKQGDDEHMRLVKPGLLFNATIVIKINIALKFLDDPAVPANVWGISLPGNAYQSTALPWAKQIRDVVENCNGKFRIFAQAPNSEFSNIKVVFTPQFCVYGAGAASASSEAGAHFKIETTYRMGGNFVVTGDTIKVDFDSPMDRIVARLLGKTTAPYALSAGDFADVVSWVGSPAVCNGIYQMTNL